jgi:hypothetical protein
MATALQPTGSIVVETVNGLPAAPSPHCAALEGLFYVTRDMSALRLSRHY